MPITTSLLDRPDKDEEEDEDEAEGGEGAARRDCLQWSQFSGTESVRNAGISLTYTAR
jgi:hypothetical protein